MLIFYYNNNQLTIKSNTFNNIEQNSNEVWEFNNFKLIYSFRLNVKTNFFPAPPPFNIINLPSFFIFFYSYLRFDRKNRDTYGESSEEWTEILKKEIKEKKEEYSLILGLF